MDNCTEHGYFFKGITDAGHTDKEDMEDKKHLRTGDVLKKIR